MSFAANLCGYNSKKAADVKTAIEELQRFVIATEVIEWLLENGLLEDYNSEELAESFAIEFASGRAREAFKAITEE